MKNVCTAAVAAAVALALPTAAFARTKHAHKHGHARHARLHTVASYDTASGRSGFAAPSSDVRHGTGGLVAPLADKVAQIVSACGAQVISGVRHTRVAGTHALSLHASGQAADLRGNPGCIYAQLRGWPGGYSTDYARVNHVHISYGGREQGLRFAHGGHTHRAVRVASGRATEATDSWGTVASNP